LETLSKQPTNCWSASAIRRWTGYPHRCCRRLR